MRNLVAKKIIEIYGACNEDDQVMYRIYGKLVKDCTVKSLIDDAVDDIHETFDGYQIDINRQVDAYFKVMHEHYIPMKGA